MKAALLAPVLADFSRIDLGSAELVLATGFYSHGPLRELGQLVTAQKLTFLTRLDLTSLDQWVRGSIAPDALLAFLDALEEAGTEVSLHVSPAAHAKVYLGEKGLLIGSANLSTRGLSGTSDEILWFDGGPKANDEARTALTEYQSRLEELTVSDLRRYVDDNLVEVRTRAKKERKSTQDEGCQPKTLTVRPIRIGTYEDFLRWARTRRDAASLEVVERAEGKHHLSGHIRRNFYGIRQLLLLHPTVAARFRTVSAVTYSLAQDAGTLAIFKTFVSREARNEAELKVALWKNYLPVSCGGNQTSGGATSGNLNRMLPLVARYLWNRIR